MISDTFIQKLAHQFQHQFGKPLPSVQCTPQPKGEGVIIMLPPSDVLTPEAQEWLKSTATSLLGRPVQLLLTQHRQPAAPKQPVRRGISHVCHIIAVVSAKGGVGKSTTALMLAYAWQALGYRVGFVDADIHGPSLPTMIHHHEQPAADDAKRFLPIRKNDILWMSMGFLVPPEAALLWRGPMIQSALTQLLWQTDWGALDFLIIDTPPGTGDVHLTLAQQVALSGVVVVSTPQELALKDVRRGMQGYQHLGVPILGMVENIATYHCPHCQQASSIFLADGVKAEAKRRAIDTLAQIPYNQEILHLTENGTQPSKKMLELYLPLAQQVADKVSPA